jgi:alkylated DNA nucleotide flippase Atl1
MSDTKDKIPRRPKAVSRCGLLGVAAAGAIAAGVGLPSASRAAAQAMVTFKMQSTSPIQSSIIIERTAA